jgi:integrase
MPNKNAIAPLRSRVKRLGKTPYYSGQVEAPDTRSYEGQGWTSTKCTTQRDAKAVAQQWAIDRLDAHRSPTRTALLGKELAKLKEDMATKWSDDSVEIHDLKSRHLIAGFGENFNVFELTRDVCTGYLNTRVLTHGVGQATVAKELSILTRVAVRCGAIREPKEVWPEALPTVFEGDDRALSIHEFLLIRKHLAPVQEYEREQPFGEAFAGRRRQMIRHEVPLGQDWRDHFTVYTCGGLRFSELYRLRPEHLTPEFLLVPGTKSKGSRRRLRLQADVREVLERRAREAGDGPLFPLVTKTSKNTWKAALANQKRNWLRALEKACERAEVPHCSTNDLRRTFATWCRDSGVDEAVCIGWMGHSDTKMVRKVYAQATMELQRTEAEKLPTFSAGVPDRTITPLPKLRPEPPAEQLN